MISNFFRARLKIYSFNWPITVRSGHFRPKKVRYGPITVRLKSEIWLTLRNPKSIVKSFINWTTCLGDPNGESLDSSLIECQYDSKFDSLCSKQLISGILVVIPKLDWSNLINALFVAIWLLALKLSFYAKILHKLPELKFKGVTPDFRPDFENLGLFNRCR